MHVKAGTLHVHNILIKKALTIMRLSPQSKCLTLRKQCMLSRTLGVWELCTANRNINLTRHYGREYEGSSNNLKIELVYNTDLLVVGINLYHSSIHTHLLQHYSLQLGYRIKLSINIWIKKMRYILYNRILFSHFKKKNGIMLSVKK